MNGTAVVVEVVRVATVVEDAELVVVGPTIAEDVVGVKYGVGDGAVLAGGVWTVVESKLVASVVKP